MSTMSAQFVNGCSLLREHPTAPKPVAKLDQFVRCDSFDGSRERSANSWSDPFIGHHEHEEFLAELSELDLLKNSTSFDDSVCPDSAGDWNAFLDGLDWMQELGPLDVAAVSPGSTTDYPSTTSPGSAEDILDRTAAIIDWKAWNHYLSNDWEADLSPLIDEDEKVQLSDGCSTPVQQRDEVMISCEPESKVPPMDAVVPCADIPVVPPSGPLTWIPSIHNYGGLDRKKGIASSCSSSSTRDSSPDRVIKRRGVKMKPPSDEGTNHRRSLNREAAFRYRERKRMEQRERRRELEQLLCHNSILKQQVKQLRGDIAEWRRKLNQFVK
ncbi:hypothetical protein Y032_0063g3443 [Ancylostoma ceylanicum]|nr:hypothetical protein Y032_0063g3443 [Ancylostoma ceylanicum]